MKTFLVILGDSFREAIDRRSLMILLIIAVAVIAFCLGVSYEAEAPEKLLARNFGLLGQLRSESGSGLVSSSFETSLGIEPRIETIRPITADDGFPEEFDEGYRVDLTFTRRELNDLVRGWRRFERRVETSGRVVEVADDPEDAGDYTREEWRQVLHERVKHDLFPYVSVTEPEVVSDEEVNVSVAVAVRNWANIPGAHKRTLLFGLVEERVIDTSLAEWVVELQLMLAGFFVGFVGLLIALSVCSSFVPSMLQKGTLDLVLARPVGRIPLLLWKYVGGLSFIFVFGSFLIGGCWLALGVRTGYWDPMFLVSVLVLVMGFAFLYAVSVTAGVWSRSTNIAFMLSIGVWGFSFAATLMYRGRDALVDAPGWVIRLIEVLYTILPKVTDLDTINTWLFSKAKLDPAAYERLMAKLPDVDWVFSLGTSFGFAAVVLALGCWLFQKRDY